MTLDVFLYLQNKRNRTSLISPIDENRKQNIGNFPHQGGGRLEWQKISPTLQSILRTFTSSAEPVRLLNSTTRPTRFGVFHLTTSDIVYDVMCK